MTATARTILIVDDEVRLGTLIIDLARHEVILEDVPLGLTNLEYELLTVLASAPGRTFTRTQLLDRVWGTDYFGDDHVVDVHIANLRKKLGEDSTQPRFISTVRGVGYRFGDRR
ncbi:winged helix-turn-helix domain-containing protein [Candidatus Chloroploca asiatica]|uniref:winged helix-turn-helix domain-containing protein n=1 Tax=Candidatus Chloroploca asiatica TaxID=1506545 RepID=UPI000BE7D8D2|nr:winged helix-turn-helix domain-containing protein [Candidatus Chloroploca asiatica]